ncbi:hypothetical protein DH2020_016866 [Rehmannia glutinosa]|uniref:Aminotransferase-like plant mobile domain-containing protein n=1 Tax=Rehmannia glutinosa TaxID=99300 RepID=A0ABR0WRV7_REHGL
MVFFKDNSSPSDIRHLVILDDESQYIDKDTILAVFDPIVGRYVTAWPRLINPSYLDEWSKEIPSSKTSKTWTLQATHLQQSTESTPLSTLGHHIIEGQAKWGDDIKFVDEFHYIKGYWEELSISLWDLHTLVGFPIAGSLYDEVVPYAKQLTGFNEAASQFLPRSCGYLLHAYHHLRKIVNGGQSSQVPISKWIRFWSKKLTKYNKPPPRTEKKRVARRKLTYNTLGNLDVHGEWSPAEKASFSKINIKESLREETYLVAFIACWLCVFVLPNDDINMIHRSTFTMAGIMASGRTVGLAVPILASIYKGLNKIVWQGVCGPKMTTFSGEGGAKYYYPADAHKWIHKGELISLTCTMITKEKYFTYVDNGNAEEFERNYFRAILSKYLPLWQGGHFIGEPYSPHRFSRQFGFYQMVPVVLKRDVRRASLDEGIHYWRLCTLSKTFSKACLPCMPPNAKKFSSEDYKTWWSKVHGSYFQENIASLINMEQSDEQPRGTKPNNGGGLVDANSQASLHVAPLANECNAQANKRKSISHPVEESSSNADRHWKRPKKDSRSLPSQDVDDKDLVNIDDDESQGSQRSIVRLTELATNSPVDEAIREEARDLAKAPKTSHYATFSVFEASTSIDFISSINENVFVVLESMKSFKNFDISHLEELLEGLFAPAAAYDEARSISSEKGSKELLSQQLSEARDRLHDAKTKENKEFAQIMSTKDDLESIKKEIDNLQKRKKNLTAALSNNKNFFKVLKLRFLILKRRLLPSKVFPH